MDNPLEIIIYIGFLSLFVYCFVTLKFWEAFVIVLFITQITRNHVFSMMYSFQKGQNLQAVEDVKFLLTFLFFCLFIIILRHRYTAREQVKKSLNK